MRKDPEIKAIPTFDADTARKIQSNMAGARRPGWLHINTIIFLKGTIMKRAIITICLMLALSASRASGRDLLVPSQYPTIQMAIDAAKDNDTVIIAPGTYTGPGNRDINLQKSITIRSQDGSETCIIDCNGSQNDPHCGFNMSQGSLTGITITRGYSNNDGGALTFYGNKNAKITNCVLINNHGARGGAINCQNGNLEIINCFLINNSVIDINYQPGGAICCYGGSVLVTNSTISGNSAGNGGGISYWDGSLIIKNCVITENHAVRMGGGIDIGIGTLLVADSNISDNSSNMGGGICCLTASENNITIKNCVINGNNVVNRGGGIYYGNYSRVTILGTDISRNSANQGAGAYFERPLSLFISDCNFYNNSADRLSGGQPMGGAIFLEVPPNYNPNSLTHQIMNTSITNNIVKGNYCQGGGLCVGSSGSSSYQFTNLMLSGCYIARNRILSQSTDTINRGGGIYSRYAIVSLSETQLLQNSAPSGGGIYNEYSRIDMSRCRISGNSAFQGSAITCISGQNSFENCALTVNGALNPEPACPLILCDSGAILKIANSTIVNNTPPVLSSTENRFSSIINSVIYWNGRDPDSWKFPPQSQFSVTYSDIQGGYTGVGNIDADPCFVKDGYWDTNGTSDSFDDFWVEGDYRLTADSPCIDAGGVAFLTDNKDLTGKPRTTGAGLDMGTYEYQNTSPVAEAGPDRTAYAWIDGNAAVTLDGSTSHDPDGDKLSYLWRWSIDDNSFEANGVSPTIQLPAGTHKITLVVNDGVVDSQPDDINITVVGPVEGRLWFWPRVINRQFWQKDVLAIIKLPGGTTKEQIDSGCKLLLYPCGIEAQTQNVVQWGDDGVQHTAIIATFDNSSLLNAINSEGIVNLFVVGKFTTGQYYFGLDTIQIIKPPPFPKPPKCDK